LKSEAPRDVIGYFCNVWLLMGNWSIAVLKLFYINQCRITDTAYLLMIIIIIPL